MEMPWRGLLLAQAVELYELHEPLGLLDEMRLRILDGAPAGNQLVGDEELAIIQSLGNPVLHIFPSTPKDKTLVPCVVAIALLSAERL